MLWREAIQVSTEDMSSTGATNILKYGLSDTRTRQQELISTLEEKQELADLIADTLENNNNTGIQVYIGRRRR